MGTLFFLNSIERQRSLRFLIVLIFIILLFNVLDDMAYSFSKSKQNLVLNFLFE